MAKEDSLLNTSSQSTIRLLSGDVHVKIAETLEEKLDYFRLRFDQYTKIGHIGYQQLTPEQLYYGMEWDAFDDISLTSHTVHPRHIYVVAYSDTGLVGGARVIEGDCPMETGTCLASYKSLFSQGDQFTLDTYREQGITPREISRLIVKDSCMRTSMNIFSGLLRMIDHLCTDNNYMFCTSKQEQLRLYEGLGFEFAGPAINYSLQGTWFPLIRDRKRAYEQPETLPRIRENYHLRVTAPIEGIPTATEWRSQLRGED